MHILGGDDWSRTSSAFRAADLQSTGVTNFPTSPKFVPDYTAPEIGTLFLASVRWQHFPLTTLFLPLLDRLTLASSHSKYEAHAVSHGSVSIYSSY